MDTNGYQAEFYGAILNKGGTPYLVKQGLGDFLISQPQDSIRTQYRVEGGSLILRGAGKLNTNLLEVALGGRFVVDNRTQAISRGTLQITVAGGEYQVLGHATEPTTIQGTLGFSYDEEAFAYSRTTYGITTLSTPGTASTTLELTRLLSSTGSFMLVRGGNLGGPAGSTYTRVHATSLPALKNGILSQIVVDTSSTGGGQTFGIYDTASDAAGLIGLRALRAGEMVTGSILRSSANGGTVAPTANFLAAGDVKVGGGITNISTLTVAPGAHLQIESGSLRITESTLLLQSGVAAEISGHMLQPFSDTLSIIGGGDLRLGAPFPAGSVVYHLGPGVLTVNRPQPNLTLVMTNGTLQAGSGNPLSGLVLTTGPAAIFEVGAQTTQLGPLYGSGTVHLAGGHLHMQPGAGSGSTFDGKISGTGAVTINSSMVLTGESSFSGPLAVANNGTLSLSGTLPNVTSLALRQGSVTLDFASAQTTAARLPAMPLDLRGGDITIVSLADVDTTVAMGDVTGRGRNRFLIRNNDAYVASKPASLTIASLERRDRGNFSFATQLANGRTGSFFITKDITPELVGDPGTTTARPILPYVLLNDQFATYEAGVGLRPLSSTEQTPDLLSGQNIRLTRDTVINGAATVNSLDFASESVLSGTGVLSVTSGAVRVQGKIMVGLDFGIKEGHLHVVQTINAGEIYGKISGSNGLTISGDQTLYLSGPSTFTGPLTINGATVSIGEMDDLGQDPSPVIMAGGTLAVEGTNSSFTFTRGLMLASGVNTLYSPNGNLIVMGLIAGPGDLRLSNSLRLESINTYTGSTLLAGTLTFASDKVFGGSPLLKTTQGATLNPTADWTTSREILLSVGGLNILTANQVVLNGSLRGSSAFGMFGTGSVSLNNTGLFEGLLSVSGGTLRLHGEVGSSLNNSFVNVGAAGRLEGDAYTTRQLQLSGTLAPGDGIGSMEIGSLTLAGASRLELQIAQAGLFDQVLVDGTVVFNGLVQLALSSPGNLPFGTAWPIVLNDGTDLISTSSTKALAIGSTVLTEGASFLLAGQLTRITYKGGDGNDIYLDIPEPAAGTFALLGLVALGVKRRALNSLNSRVGVGSRHGHSL